MTTKCLPLAVLTFTMFAAVTNAQSCPGSYATYIVRDAKGAVIKSPPGEGVSYTAVGDSPAAKKWRYSIDGEFVRVGITLPAALNRIAGDVKGISTSQFCNFPEPLTLKVTLGGKTMQLTFKFPRMGEQESADFVIDSLPFKAGKYEITLAKPTGAGLYYASTLWKKVP